MRGMGDRIKKLLDVIVPCHNEAGNVFSCVRRIIETIDEHAHGLYSIIIINDNSTDGTQSEIDQLHRTYPDVSIKSFKRTENPGFGNAVREGLKYLSAEYFCLIMADASDNPADLLRMIHMLQQDNVLDVIFTNRFKQGGRAIHYPLFKRICNRLANLTIACLYTTRFTDLSNAFKVIRSSLLQDQQIVSENFELTVELALIALTQGKKHTELRISWMGRDVGTSKFKVIRNGPTYISQIIRFLPVRYSRKQ